MLVQLGRRDATDDLVELLLECHGRMRKFLIQARRLAEAAGWPDHELREAAHQIARYFTGSFPLHVADEDDQIAPRLTGTAPAVDRALATVAADHVRHDPAIQRLIAACDAIAREPAALARVAQELSTVAAQIATDLESHLELEEREIFPYVRRLPAAAQAEIRAALRERRERASRTTT